MDLVGLASQATREARERVRSAVKNSGFNFPNRKIIVNLAPADIKKEGSHFDLAIALGIIIASGQIESDMPDKCFWAGELSLDGSLRGVPGILPMALELMKTSSDKYFIVPEANRQEAGLVSEVRSLAAWNLQVELSRVNFEQLRDRESGESSAVMREKVTLAREIQKKRFARYRISLNSQMRPADVKKFCKLDEESERLLKNVFDRLQMSARAHDRILKVARTIADLEQSENIKIQNLAEALQYRSLDRKYWRS